jgi:hypothetical protein
LSTPSSFASETALSRIFSQQWKSKQLKVYKVFFMQSISASQGQGFKIIFNVNGPGLFSFKSEMSVF